MRIIIIIFCLSDEWAIHWALDACLVWAAFDSGTVNVGQAYYKPPVSALYFIYSLIALEIMLLLYFFIFIPFFFPLFF